MSSSSEQNVRQESLVDSKGNQEPTWANICKSNLTVSSLTLHPCFLFQLVRWRLLSRYEWQCSEFLRTVWKKDSAGRRVRPNTVLRPVTSSSLDIALGVKYFYCNITEITHSEQTTYRANCLLRQIQSEPPSI